MRVSVATPVYSVSRYIERCARSLFEQTYDDIEFVFVDDASPDNSMEILRGLLPLYPGRNNSIKIITHPHNRGLSAARNTAVEHCSGDFIIHVDSDDYLEKDAIEKLVEMQARTGADIVSGDAVSHTRQGDFPFDEPDYPDKYAMLRNLTGQMGHHMIWGRLIRKSLYTDNHISAEEGCNVGEDWQAIVPLVYYSNTIAHLHSRIYHYNCMNPASYMAQKNSTGINEKIARQDFRSLEIVKGFVEGKDQQLYSLIKATGRTFAHSIMDECVKQNKHSLFLYFSRELDADNDLFDRGFLSRMVDRCFPCYWLYYNMRRIYRKLFVLRFSA